MKKQKAKSVKKKTKSTKTPKAKKPAKVITLATLTARIEETVASKKEETMDRAALKVVAAQLKEMGSDVKVLKSDTDEALQKKVNEALQKLPTSDMMKKLESIVPEKLVSVLKRDCIGIFIDLSDVSCVRCPEAAACAKQFISNLKGGLKAVDAALAEPPAEKKKAKASITPVTRYEGERLVFTRDMPNPNPEGDPYHDTFDAVLEEMPDTLAELRAIVERDFDIDSDADFMKLVTSMRDPKEGIVMLDVDLSDGHKTALRAAGYDV